MSLLAVFLFSLIILPLQNYECKHDKEPHDPLNPKEKKALLDFINNVKHSKDLNWNESKEPACSWKGVQCDGSNETVLYLRLPAKDLVGTIPRNTLGMLISLRALSIHSNGLSGELPPDLSNLMTTLSRLSLNNNKFNGTIPSYFSNFTFIRFELNSNKFSGQIPYINPDKLRKFNVSVNELSTSVPTAISKFPKAVFAPNVYLCDPPFNIVCDNSHQQPVSPIQGLKEKNPKKKGEIVIGVSIGSGVVLLILLCCVRKKVYQQMKQPRKLLLEAPEGERNKLVFFDDRISNFDVEDLLKASAEVLGEGSVGTSYKQVLHEKKTTVVVKRLKDVVVTENEFRTRMEVLGKMRNENLVQLIGWFYSNDEKWLVSDYMQGGSLYAHLHGTIGRGRARLDWDHRVRIALSAARGLAYLHAEKVVHGNIRSSNILLRKETNNTASLSDYGLNMFFGESNSINHHVIRYWAPEFLNTREVTFKSDVYSFGVFLLELLTGQNPKQASLDKEGVDFSKWVESIVYEEPKAEIFDEEIRRDHNIKEMFQLLQIAKSCVSIVPDQRPTMNEVVSMMDDMWLRQSSDDHSKGYDDTPSTETRATPSTITP